MTGELAVGLRDGWQVARSEIQQGSGSICLAPTGETLVVFDCAVIAICFGKRPPARR